MIHVTDTPHLFDSIEMEYIAHNGWCINADGLLVITAKQASKAPYLGRSIRNPAKHTLMIPSLYGCTTLLEGNHFIIVN